MRRRLLAIAVLCASSSCVLPGQALAGGPCPECSGSYSGTWDATSYTKNTPFSGLTTTTISLTWKWTLSYDSRVGNVWRLTEASGSFSIAGTPPGRGPDCSAQLSLGPDAVVHGESFWGAIGDGIGPSGATGYGEYYTVLDRIPAQWGESLGADPLRERGAASGSGCASQSNTTVGFSGPWAQSLGGPDCLYDNSAGIDYVAFPIGDSFTVPERCSGSGADTEHGVSWKAKLSSSLSFRSPGHGPGGGPIHAGTHPAGTGKTFKDLKDEAAADFRKAFKDAQGPCVQLAMGLGVEATGAVWLGTSATVPGGLPAGGAVISAGEVMTAAAGSLCVPKVKRLLDDYRTFDDPPDSHYRELAAAAGSAHAATLIACGKLTGSVRAFCLELKARVELLIAAADHTAAVDDAIVTTINRASGAKRAHDKRALARQLSHAVALERELRSALASESGAGRAIQHLLPFGDLKRSQSARAIAYLERRGLTQRELARIEPRGAGAAATDPISRLVHP